MYFYFKNNYRDLWFITASQKQVLVRVHESLVKLVY